MLDIGILWVASIFVLFIALALHTSKVSAVMYLIAISSFLFTFIVAIATTMFGKEVQVRDCPLYTESETTQGSDRIFYIEDADTNKIESVKWSSINTIHNNSSTEHLVINEKQWLCFRCSTQYTVYLK